MIKFNKLKLIFKICRGTRGHLMKMGSTAFEYFLQTKKLLDCLAQILLSWPCFQAIPFYKKHKYFFSFISLMTSNLLHLYIQYISLKSLASGRLLNISTIVDSSTNARSRVQPKKYVSSKQ